MAHPATAPIPLAHRGEEVMTNLPDFRRSRKHSVRLVPVQDLNDVQWMLWAVLALQMMILLVGLFRA
jgi:hypothetical protein